MATTKPLISIIGSLNVDFVTTTPRCPAAGETLTATSLDISGGGKGANQAVGCGRASFTSPNKQDVDVEMIGAVGKGDVYVQKLLMPTLRESGVSTDGVIECENAQTGTASIVVEGSSGENRIMVVPGANHDGMTDFNEVLHRTIKNEREPDVIVMQGEIPRATVLSLLQRFNHIESRTRIVFNPAPVFPEGIPAESLENLSVLVVNETETIMLGQSMQRSGFDMTGVEKDEDLQSESKLSKLAQQFHDIMKINIVLITLGGRGAFFSDMHSGRRGLVPGVKVSKVVDTTAAGDTFVGYLAVSLARHMVSKAGKGGDEFDIKGAIEKANAAAAKCVQRAGAMQSIPFGYE